MLVLGPQLAATTARVLREAHRWRAQHLTHLPAQALDFGAFHAARKSTAGHALASNALGKAACQ